MCNTLLKNPAHKLLHIVLLLLSMPQISRVVRVILLCLLFNVAGPPHRSLVVGTSTVAASPEQTFNTKSTVTPQQSSCSVHASEYVTKTKTKISDGKGSRDYTEQHFSALSPAAPCVRCARGGTHEHPPASTFPRGRTRGRP